jgi:hypothetical protein
LRRPVLLPLTRTTLRWIFRADLAQASRILVVAETAAREDQGPTVVLSAIIDRFPQLPADVLLEVGAALERDLPLDDLGAAVFRGMQWTGEGARAS